jgi:hypothetical protein
VSNKIRWSLRILGWLLVFASLAPRGSSVDQGPGTESSLTFGFPASPLYIKDRTVIHAGVANLPDVEEVKNHSHFNLASWSMLALLAGAVLVSASNRRAVRAPLPS